MKVIEDVAKRLGWVFGGLGLSKTTEAGSTLSVTMHGLTSDCLDETGCKFFSLSGPDQEVVVERALNQIEERLVSSVVGY